MEKRKAIYMDVNKVILLGRLVKDPVAKALSSGQEISRFTLATNYLYKDSKTKEKKENVDFHSIVAWGKIAQISNKYLTQGSKIYIEGRLNNRNWEDKNKQKHYRTEIVVSELNMLGGGKKKEETKQEELAQEEITVEEVPVNNN
ncbi:single-stranded DNA-binding protein [Patescibacteria group bacterium]|nr:single-stranded DNA-binding protein [Patescibacteria group bacterium]